MDYRQLENLYDAHQEKVHYDGFIKVLNENKIKLLLKKVPGEVGKESLWGIFLGKKVKKPLYRTETLERAKQVYSELRYGNGLDEYFAELAFLHSIENEREDW